ncbi:MAG TPA: hypothetical protein VEX18_12790 [Polyangiaceae bacterium]|nr:hypothetical protein [Polyangiaceae bacterium]
MVAATPSDARVFVLHPGKHARLFGRLFRRLGIAVLLALAMVQLLYWWSSTEARYANSGLVYVLTLLGLLSFLVGFFWLLLWTSASRYRLLLGPSWLATDSNGSFRQQVSRENLAHLCEGPMGLVLVEQRGIRFRIPRSLNGYEVVREQLLTWLPLTPRQSSHFRSWLGILAKLAIVLLSLLVALAGALLLAVLNVLLHSGSATL